jgi:hypothetical protein
MNTQLTKGIEILQEENFNLKTKNEELIDAYKGLERRLGEEKLKLEKKISNLCGVMEKMELHVQ